jgi:hypothetical protein
MKFLQRAAIAAALALPLSAVSVSAQFYRWDFTVLGGGSWPTGNILDRSDFDFLDGTVVVDDNLSRSVDLGSGGLVGGQLGFWFNKRFGVRANFAYAASNVDRHRLLFTDQVLFDPLEFFDHDINLWSGTGDLMIRIREPRTRWDGFEWLPFIALGAGAEWINPAGDQFNVVDEFPLVVNPLADNLVSGGIDAIPLRCSIVFNTCAVLEKKTQFAGLVAIGTDLRFSPMWSARIEFGDRIFDAPIREVAFSPDFPFVFENIGNLSRTVNQLYLTGGVSILFGLQKPPVRAAVVPRPAPPPPPPPPATEEITVCVIDPTYAQGLRTITATRNLSTGDTTVMKDGHRMPLAEAVGNVPTAGNATWYVSGAPMEIGMMPNRIQYVSVGGARTIEAGELAYIGTVNGVPVFADRLTLAPGLANLGPNTDLNQLIGTSPDARKALETVAVVYVPLQPTGCVFQAMQKQQEIRKK